MRGTTMLPEHPIREMIHRSVVNTYRDITRIIRGKPPEPTHEDVQNFLRNHKK